MTCDFRRSEISQRRSASPVPRSLRKLLIDRRMRLSEVTEWVEPTGPEYHEGRKCARGYSGQNVPLVQKGTTTNTITINTNYSNYTDYTNYTNYINNMYNTNTATKDTPTNTITSEY